MDDRAFYMSLVHVAAAGLFRLAVLIVGYLIAKLGYQLLIKGVTGEFRFQTQFKGVKSDLISASPGLFFILMATILIASAVLKFESTFNYDYHTSGSEILDEAMKNKPAIRKEHVIEGGQR